MYIMICLCYRCNKMPTDLGLRVRISQRRLNIEFEKMVVVKNRKRAKKDYKLTDRFGTRQKGTWLAAV